MRGSTLAAMTLALATSSFASGPPIHIELRGERISIRAEKVPLVQVLNGVAWEAKIKIVYDTTPPQDIVTIDLKDLNVSDAITQLLRGHGLVYVARMDASGARVDTLVLTSGGPGSVRLSSPPPPPSEAPPQEYYDAGVEMQPEQMEPPPDMMPVPMPPPTPTPPSTAWSPSPIVMPGGMPGMPTGATGQPMYPGQQPGQPPMYPHGAGMGMGMGRGGHPGPPGYYPPPPPPPPDEQPPQEMPPEQ